jgi:hypothetical protein
MPGTGDSPSLIRNDKSKTTRLSLTKLAPNTSYQLFVFIGDDSNPRGLADVTTDATGSVAVKYVQKCPGNSNPGGQPLPSVLDPISRIHQLDVVKDGTVILSGVVGSDLRSDCTAPMVNSTVPGDTSTDVAINQNIAATFSEPMDPLTLTKISFTLSHANTTVAGVVTYAGTTATFNPAAALAPFTRYTARITTRAKDLSGNGLASNVVWSFTTGAAPDTQAPTITSTVPLNSATGVPASQTITATFSEAMNPSTINTTTFTLTGLGGAPVAGVVGYDVTSKITAFAPTTPLALNTVYTATITTGAKDLAGNGLASNAVWSFTTATATTGQAGVVLGSSGGFAVLAGSAVTSTGVTVVNGNLGVSPGTAVTGFGPGTLNGAMHAGDSAAAQAELDLTTAYDDAAGRTLGAVTIAGNLGGLTLTPGLYKSTSSLEISSGDLTLDAQGDSNAIFIFQIASTLTTTSGRQVILSRGTKASNVFWQVASSAALGTSSVFKGTILADQSITLATGATLDGRALARIAAVTLEANTVTIPAP